MIPFVAPPFTGGDIDTVPIYRNATKIEFKGGAGENADALNSTALLTSPLTQGLSFRKRSGGQRA
jgi:hypothetical protein